MKNILIKNYSYKQYLKKKVKFYQNVQKFKIIKEVFLITQWKNLHI